tara:strand:+ start:427 stop:558 length:132 start_codon:yes stop_codon:yes gene_type:complete
MSKSKKYILTEAMSEDVIRQLIRMEIARIFFDLYKKRSTWERA